MLERKRTPEATVELLMAENDMLRRQLGIEANRERMVTAMSRLNLTEKEARLLLILGGTMQMSREVALLGLYDFSDDAAEMKIIDVFICKLRHKLARHGVKIRTLWGYGYILDAPAREKLAEIGVVVA